MKTAKDLHSQVIVNIQPGPITPAQARAWRLFWQKLISEVKTEHEKGASR